MTETGTAVSLALATLASEDLAAISAAVLAGEGYVSVWLAMAAVSAGIYIGDLLLFAAGRVAGRIARLRRMVLSRWTTDQLEQLARALDCRLAAIVLSSRFVPGSRLPMYIAAGMFSRRPTAFCLWTLVAVLIWTPLLVMGVIWSGEAFRTSADIYLRWAPVVVLIGAVHLAIRAQAVRRRA